MSALDLTAFGLFGMVLTGLTAGFSSPTAFVSPGGGMGAPLEMALTAPEEARAALGGPGYRPKPAVVPAVASFPRGF